MGATWSERGSVAVHSTRSGSASVEQASLESDRVSIHPAVPVKTRFSPESNFFQVDALGSLCQSGGREGGLYLVKASQSGGLWEKLKKFS